MDRKLDEKRNIESVIGPLNRSNSTSNAGQTNDSFLKNLKGSIQRSIEEDVIYKIDRIKDEYLSN